MASLDRLRPPRRRSAWPWRRGCASPCHGGLVIARIDLAGPSQPSAAALEAESRSQERLDRLPPRLLPVLYFAFGHVCLGLAFLALALTPETLAGFFYHSRILAVVHLVTLGWISGSILGALYIIAPMAFRMQMPARKLDYAAFALFVIGVMGMVTHFWLNTYNGMVWSALTVITGLVLFVVRLAPPLLASKLPPAIKLHIGLAFFNILVAGIVGALLGIEKLMINVLPGQQLTNVYAHAHLAALGWGTMMVIGAGYRLFPMFLPAAMPAGPRLYVSAVLLEVGALGLFAALILGSPWVALFAALTIAGLLAFATQVAWMKRNPRPAPKALQSPDFGMLHNMQALAYLGLSVVLGLALLIAPPLEWKLRAAAAYGVLGLVGFLSQMVVGMSARLWPMFSWTHSFVGSGFAVPPPTPHVMPDRRLQALTFFLWVACVPLLAAGLYFPDVALVRASAWGLFAAVVAETLNSARVLRFAFGYRRKDARGAQR
jgi:hypothetical protein